MQLTAEQKEFKRFVREFVDKEICPVAMEYEESGEFPYQIIQRCGELGFLDVLFPLGNDDWKRKVIESAIVLEEVSRGLGSLGLILCPQYQSLDLISLGATEELKKEVLAPALKGQKILGYALTEESGGSNALDISTSAVLDGEQWVVNGAKCWVTNAGVADGYIIAAKTATGSQRRSISLFYIDSQDPGFSAIKNEEMLGLTNSIMGEIRFENCRIPTNRLIGEKNGGYPLVKLSLNAGRLALAAVAVGVAQKALELALDYSGKRGSYERKISSYQGISFMIADMYANITCARNMVYHVASLCEDGLPYTTDVAAIKLFASEMCCKVCKDSLQIHGAYGLSKRAEIERCLRDSHMLTVAEGTSQACRIVISTALANSPIEQYSL